MDYSKIQSFMNVWNNAVVQHDPSDILAYPLSDRHQCADGYKKPTFWEKLAYIYSMVDVSGALENRFFACNWDLFGSKNNKL